MALVTEVRLSARSALALAVSCAVLASAHQQPARAAGVHQQAPPHGSVAQLRPVCSRAIPGQARCLALEEVPGASLTAPAAPGAAGTRVGPAGGERCAVPNAQEGCDGLRPQDLHTAYELPDSTPAAATQTIAVVAYYDDPTIKKDLNTFDQVFGLPECSTRNGCFEELNEQGKRRPLPEANGEAAREQSLDVEMAHAICQNCHILLVVASSPKLSDLEAAEDTAAAAHATEISNSWAMVGEGQPAEPTEDSPAFDHPGVVITAAAGDWGYRNDELQPTEEGANYPASSPHVVAVGGTRLQAGPSGEWRAESVWNAGKLADGSGCSRYFAAPAWQVTLTDWFEVGCGNMRAVSDISAVAEASVEGDPHPYTGIAVYDSTPLGEEKESPWHTLYGTSAAAPLIAAAFALAGGGQEVEFPARTLYENDIRDQTALHDVLSGSNGTCAAGFNGERLSRCEPAEMAASCEGALICLAGEGYDGPTGLGTPDGLGVFDAGGLPVLKPQRIRFTSAPPPGASTGGPTYSVSAQSSSDLQVSLTTAAPSVCMISNSLVSFLSAGTCTIDANQAGDSEFDPAPQAQQSFSVAAASGGSGEEPSSSPSASGQQSSSGSSQELSFNASHPPAGGVPLELHVTGRGTVTIALSLAGAGRLSWALELDNALLKPYGGRARCAFGHIRHGRCRPLLLAFATGARTFSARGAVRLVLGPQAAAAAALRRAAARSRGLSLSISLRFRPSPGGSPFTLAEHLRIRPAVAPARRR